MKKYVSYFKNIYSCLTQIRGINTESELYYLIDLISGTIARRIFSISPNKIPVGGLLLKDSTLIVKNKHDSIFYCPKKSDILFHVLPYYEDDIWNILKDIMKKNDVFIDVGAHIGTYTIPIAHIIGKNGTCLAVEPSPTIIYLSKSIELNKLDNVIIIQNAVYSKHMTTSMPYDPLRTGASSINKNGDNKFDVETVTLDEIVERYLINCSNIKAIKIDTEGLEIDVLKGASKVLDITDHVVIESTYKNVDTVISILRSKGFELLAKYQREESYDIIAYKVGAYENITSHN